MESQTVLPATGALFRISSLAGPHGRIGVSKSTIWAWVAQGRFPQPVRLGRRVTVWLEEDINAFVANSRTGRLIAEPRQALRREDRIIAFIQTPLSENPENGFCLPQRDLLRKSLLVFCLRSRITTKARKCICGRI